MFRRTTAVARDGLPHIFAVDLYPIGDDFAGQSLVKREKLGHADSTLDVREVFFIMVYAPKSVGLHFAVVFQKWYAEVVSKVRTMLSKCEKQLV